MSAATDNLRNYQQQLDMDGVIVGVSRQAVHETLEQYAEMLAALKDLHADCVEYARINNLHNSDGSPATHHSMRRAAAAVAKAEKLDG